MPMYALATIPLIRKDDGNIMLIWYADDTSAVGLVKMYDNGATSSPPLVPKFVYFANALKMWLVTKQAHLAKATSAFADMDIKVMKAGCTWAQRLDQRNTSHLM